MLERSFDMSNPSVSLVVLLQPYVDLHIIASVPKRLHSFLLDPEMAAGLKRVKQRDGIGEGEQVRRALARWLKSKGALKVRKGGTRTR